MSDATRNYVTIVSGLPRSGTSMMMRMIDAGGIQALTDKLREADDDNPRGYYEFEPVKKTKEDSSWVANAVGKVVKMVHLLLMDLPEGYEYRVIFMRRHLDEVLKSQDVMLERAGKGGGDLPVDTMKSIFEKQIKQVYDWVGQRSSFKLLEVNYNEIMAAPREHVEKINALLDGNLNVEAMAAVIEPDLYRQRAK
jgi:hypothetical protein